MQSARSSSVRRALQGICRNGNPTRTASTSCPPGAALCSPGRAISHRLLQQGGLRPRQSALAAVPSLSSVTTTIRHGSSSSPSSSEPLAKTPLYDFHLSKGGKMVPFGGFHMPVQYAGLSVSQSHIFTREHASIFDVSHMVQRIFSGPGAASFLERVTPSGIAALQPHKSTLSVLLHADGSGGIVDDTIITRLPGEEDKFYVVTNAACREKDDEYFEGEMEKWNGEHAEKEVRQEQLDGWGLVALQGPDAKAVLAQVLDESSGLDLSKLYFGRSGYAKLKLRGMKLSSPVLISRGGYTGEDGFEISIPADETVDVTEALLAAGPDKVQLAGLGARDSLRLEAGMCLYGHDLNDSTTPVEAGLSWIIPKERRTPDAGFYGADVISGQLVTKSKGGTGVSTRRVGFIVEGAPAREGAEIVSREPGEDGKPVKLGVVTSGCPSPTLGKNIAMGYIKDGFHKAGTEVDVVVRGRARKAVVSKMPFVPTGYYREA
ncbi:hypothetical protein QBC47DRAFT_295718 [Echria macrotheca]|uniref:Aminomethyltransferase n=1 Tax=Echria macrotheca TaxID=438768 RepID=A0AAJ0FBS0_9PEZI|nr:hypothetical protein QBC47DRAFT_295718 [Echria macrotheca]